jgi:hypothetical protein
LREAHEACKLEEASRKLAESLRSLQNACRKLAGSVHEALEAGAPRSLREASRKRAKLPESLQEASGELPGNLLEAGMLETSKSATLHTFWKVFLLKI